MEGEYCNWHDMSNIFACKNLLRVFFNQQSIITTGIMPMVCKKKTIDPILKAFG